MVKRNYMPVTLRGYKVSKRKVLKSNEVNIPSCATDIPILLQTESLSMISTKYSILSHLMEVWACVHFHQMPHCPK